jgi:hypothetical protein
VTDEDERTTPIGLFNFAHSYWRSAVALQGIKVRATSPDQPVSFLYIHALELYLKAFLLVNGVSLQDLRSRKYGHKICCLSEKARTLGFEFDELDTEILSIIACIDIIEFRYIVAGYKTLPTHEALDATCRNFHIQAERGLHAKGIKTRPYPEARLKRD